MDVTSVTKLWFGLILLGFVAASGCRRQDFDNNPANQLRFSADTLHFDTVFTTVGSITLPLTIYNDHDGSILIDRIHLEEGNLSEFRVNVNGQPMENLQFGTRDVVIGGKDSMYVFVEVTVDPNDNAGELPFLIAENLLFDVKGIGDTVKLLARGQNAIFHGEPGRYTLIPDGEIWDATLPHVLYGRLIVDNESTLVILPGTKIYGHPGSGIWVNGGTLLAEGELDLPIVFEGDRLDDYYDDRPGQWGLSFEFTDSLEGNLVNFNAFRGGIWLDRARECHMDHVILKESTVGVWVDSVAAGAAYALRITNSQISFAESIGLLSQSGWIRGFNNLFSDCGQACGYFAYGGDIQLHLSTFANYSTLSNKVRQFPTLYLNDWYEDVFGNVQVRPFSNASEFRNCIAWGNNVGLNDFSEVVVDLFTPSFYTSPLLTASAIHENQEGFPSSMIDNLTTTDLAPPFSAPESGDFRLTGNATIWKGVSSSPPFDTFEISSDLDGVSRNPFEPTKGCYERP